MIIWGEGATRLSAMGFQEAIKAAEAHFQEAYTAQSKVYNKISAPKINWKK